MGNYFWVIRTGFFRPNTRVLLGGTAKNTGRLLRMLPGVFHELSKTVFRFSRVHVLISGAANRFFSGGSKIRLFVRTGARNYGYEDFR